MTRSLGFGLTLILLLVASPNADAHERFRFIGTIVKMDVREKLLTIKTGRKDQPPELVIDVTAKTRIERDGRKVTAAELKPGRYVVVDALGDDWFGTEAVLIKLVPPPAKPAGTSGR